MNQVSVQTCYVPVQLAAVQRSSYEVVKTGNCELCIILGDDPVSLYFT